MEYEGKARRFTIVDGMILVAASAVALVIARGDFATSNVPAATWLGRFGPLASWVVLAMTPAVVALRLRRPRPPRDELWSQPGLVACVGVLVAAGLFVAERFVSLGLLALKGMMVADTWRSGVLLVLQDVTDALPLAGSAAVATSWLVLAAAGRWHAERGWIDRLGRVAGLYWPLIYVARSVEIFFIL